jgi:lipopolysaccharide biosynthesis glycosyltransferase
MRTECAIVVLNLWDDRMVPNARNSIQHAANRWGVKYVEIARPLYAGGRDAYLEKMSLDQHCASFDRVVYFDRDVVVRSDCPNLFELVEPSEWGAVLSEQEGHHFHQSIMDKLSPICNSLGATLNVEQQYFNSGALVFNPSFHASVFQYARNLASFHDYSSWQVSDQGLLSIAVSILRSRYLRILDSNYNRCGAPCWQDWTPEMKSYVLHFCGPREGRNKKIAATNWMV